MRKTSYLSDITSKQDQNILKFNRNVSYFIKKTYKLLVHLALDYQMKYSTGKTHVSCVLIFYFHYTNMSDFIVMRVAIVTFYVNICCLELTYVILITEPSSGKFDHRRKNEDNRVIRSSRATRKRCPIEIVHGTVD